MKLLLGNIILKFLDVLLTYIILQLGGTELNPLVRYLINKIQLEPALTIVFLVTVVLLLSVYRLAKNPVKYMLALFILHSCIVLWNSLCLVKIYLIFGPTFGIM